MKKLAKNTIVWILIMMIALSTLSPSSVVWADGIPPAVAGMINQLGQDSYTGAGNGNHYYYFTLSKPGTYELESDSRGFFEYTTMKSLESFFGSNSSGITENEAHNRLNNNSSVFTQVSVQSTNPDGTVAWKLNDVNSSGDQYVYRILGDFTIRYVSADANLNPDAAPSGQSANANTPGMEEDDEAELLERILTTFLLVLGDGALHLIGIALGGSVSLDSLIFNGYTNTQLSFFDGEGGTNGIIAGNRTNINEWFNRFREIAIVCYLIICLYMGIRIVLSSTGGSKAKYQDLVGYWIKGVAILFLFPYVMKYTIMVNNTMVAIINENKSGIFTEQITGIQGIEGGFGNTMDYGTDDRFSGDDYMGSMRKIAGEKGWIAYAIVWLIMITQLVTFIFIYYKRLLMVMFLIIIFPLVTISYAIDKVGDGKSQAFNNWFKEFFINVFIQLFHAILYVLVMGTIFSSGGSAFRANWLLIMFGITFISKGEPILRGLLGQGGSGAGTLTSIAATAVATRGMVKATQSFAKKASKQGQHLKSGINAARQYRVASLAEKKGFIPRATPSAARESAGGSETYGGYAPNSQLESALPVSSEERRSQISSAMAVMNNPGGDPASKAIAAQTLQRYKGTKELDEVLKASGVDAAEFNELMGAVDVMANINMLNDVQINQKLRILRKNMGRGGMYSAMLAQSGLSEDEIEELYGRSMLLNSIRVGEGAMIGAMMADGYYGGGSSSEEVSTEGQPRTMEERIKIGTLKNGKGKRISGTAKRQGRMKNVTRSGSGGSKVGNGAPTSGGSESSKAGATGNVGGSASAAGTGNGVNRGGSSASAGGVQTATGEGSKKNLQRKSSSAPEYAGTFERKSRNVNKSSGNRAANVQRRREAQKSMHQNMANSYVKDVLGVKNIQELNTLQDRKEAQSYMKLAGAAAKLNNTNTGVYDFEEIKKNIDTYRSEAEKQYTYTEELADKLNFDIDEYEYNWAAEVSRHAEHLNGSEEEKEAILKQAQEIVEKNAGRAEAIREQMKKTKDVQEMEALRKKAAIYEAVDGKLNKMPEEEGPIKMEGVEEIQEPDFSTQDNPIDWGEYKKEKLKEAASELAKGALGTTFGVATGVFGAAAGAAVSGAEEKEIDKVIAGAAVGSGLGSSFGSGVASIPEEVVGKTRDLKDFLTGKTDELTKESNRAYAQAQAKYEAEYLKKMQEAYHIGRAEAEDRLQREREQRKKMYSVGDRGTVSVVGKDGRILPKKDSKK